jgi:PhzF family phenazine biosynthesis protein
VGLRVFIRAPHGGNPVPLVADATGMTDAQMQSVAQRYGHESAFILPATDSRADWRIRFFVPNHEMEMCGHATVGSMWALRSWGKWVRPTAVIQTMSGLVEARWDPLGERVWISQPRATWAELPDVHRTLVASVLGLAPPGPFLSMANASTSRAKTLVRMGSVAQLQALMPRLADIETVCETIGSTGLYPYAFGDSEPGGPEFFARQFPKASGYPEDAATGIAAAALWGYLEGTRQVACGTSQLPITCVVRQGDAMNKPSAIEVRARFSPSNELQGCWISGQVGWMDL